jgi:hypothetical protein
MTPIQYNWNVPLYQFMMNADINVFLKGLDYTTLMNSMPGKSANVLNMLDWKETKFQCGENQKQG